MPFMRLHMAANFRGWQILSISEKIVLEFNHLVICNNIIMKFAVVIVLPLQLLGQCMICLRLSMTLSLMTTNFGCLYMFSSVLSNKCPLKHLEAGALDRISLGSLQHSQTP